MLYSQHLKGDDMKNLIVNMLKKRNAKVQAKAEMAKGLVSKNKSEQNQLSDRAPIVENKEVMKESRTLMLD